MNAFTEWKKKQIISQYMSKNIAQVNERVWILFGNSISSSS